MRDNLVCLSKWKNELDCHADARNDKKRQWQMGRNDKKAVDKKGCHYEERSDLVI